MPDEQVPESAAAYCAGILMGFQLFANAAARTAGVLERQPLPSGFLEFACHSCRQQLPSLRAFDDHTIIQAARAFHAAHPVRS